MGRKTNNRRPKTLEEHHTRARELMICFCFGFMWSTILACCALVLSQLFWIGTSMIITEKPCEKRIIGTYRLWEHQSVTVGHLSKLTHLNFASVFYQLDGTIGFGHPDERIRLERVNAKAKPFGVKTMITLELVDPQNKDIPGLMRDDNRQKVLIDSISSFIREYQFDGLNLVWEAPRSERVKMFVQTLCRKIREEFTRQSKAMRRKEPYLIGLFCHQYILKLDYDELFKYVDFLNLDTDNYYAHWLEFPLCRFTGPPTPIYSGHEKNKKHNLDATMKHFTCLTRRPNQLNILTAFSGRKWYNVTLPKDPSETLWMTADYEDGRVSGKVTLWVDHDDSMLSPLWNNESKTPYTWDPETRTYHAFENGRSLEEKIKYAIEKNIGGISIWSINEDDKQESLLTVLGAADLCSGNDNKAINYDCDDI